MRLAQADLGLETDLTRDAGWDALSAAGLRGVATVSIDDTWSGLRFRPVEDVRSRTRTARRRPSRMVDMAALTVVVPVWDRYVRWLDECVESILAQRAECDLRVLVLDNASTRPLPEQPPEVAMVRTPERLSVGAARNHALAQVETPLVPSRTSTTCSRPATSPSRWSGCWRARSS